MRLIDIFQTASGNMMRSKLRSFLTIVAIFIGAFTLTLTNGIGAGISNYIDKQLGNLGASNVIEVQPTLDNPLGEGLQEYDPNRTVSGFGGTGTVPVLTQKDIETIRSQPGVEKVEPTIAPTPDYIQGNSDKKYQFSMQPFIEGTNYELAAGAPFDPASAEREIMVPVSYVETLGFSSNEAAIGQRVTIGISSALGAQQEVDATIVGVQEATLVSTFGGAVGNKALSDALVAIQQDGLSDTQKHRYFSVLAFASPDANEQEMQKIKDELSQKGYTAATIEDQIGLFKQVIDAIIIVFNVFATIALVAASFGIVNTLLMAVQERTKEIGLMKAVGMGSSKIFLLFSIEAVLLGFWGSLLGSLAGVGVGLAANQIASETFLKDLVGFDLTVFSLASVAIIMLIIMAIAFLAGTLPARRASKKDPITALRYE